MRRDTFLKSLAALAAKIQAEDGPAAAVVVIRRIVGV